MWKMKNSLNNVILKYFIIFSISIMSFLWIFQFLFFNSFYKEQKINDIKSVATKINKYQNKRDFNEIINTLALDKSVCIEIEDKNFDSLYHSTYFGKGCLSNKQTTEYFKFDFMRSNDQEKQYELTNRDNDTTIVYAMKLNDDRYAFVNTSIIPVDGITSLITKQLAIMTLLILILSYVLAYFISNHIANPIKEINTKAKMLAKGKFDFKFDNKSKITEINDLTSTLNYTKDELSKTEEYRRDLMANVSHDLKTPLTMIKAYAEMSMDLHENNKEKQKEDMATIISETDRLTVLVNDILSLSKMQTTLDTLDITKFDLIELTEEILKKYNLYQETENYKFVFNKNKKKILINADKKKIEQVIYNLINNAINYTGDDNTVTINITEKNNQILVEIIDTGKGIKEEDIPYIWDKYYKNKRKHKRNLVGTGLGLSIVKNIFELHKYEYGVKTKKDKGSNFYFIIPKEK